MPSMHHTNLDDVLRPYTRLIEIEIRGEKRPYPKKLPAEMLSITIDGHYFLRRFLLERRMS